MVLRGEQAPGRRARVEAVHPLVGVRAGSALVLSRGRLLVVQDDAFAVAWITLGTFEVATVALVGDGAPLAKPEKPDFEAAAVTADGAIWILGSGSTPRRCKVVRFDPERGLSALHDRTAMYEALSGTASGRPNVEGAVVDGDRLRLFHRGAGGAPSAVVDLSLGALEGSAPEVLSSTRIELGELGGITLGITDVTRAGNATWVLAAAEDTMDAIADGRVIGSVVGEVDGDAIAWTPIVDADGALYPCKAEGIAVDADGAGAWVVTDPDDAEIPASLLRLRFG